jgi:hypothetical protein
VDVQGAFAFAPIHHLHQTRTRRIRDLVDPATTCSTYASLTRASVATAYTLAHHVLQGTEAAARDRELAAFDWYAQHPDANAPALSTPTAAGPRVVVAPDLARLSRSEISETPYYVLGPATVSAPDKLREIASAAYATAAEIGFADLLAGHAVVLCLLRQKSVGDTLDSWTITRLPGTVFCDHYAEPVVLARDLVHEAGHNWLNDAFAATRCTLPEEPRFFSPWKGTRRPAFGFLHACWAFPLMMIYTSRVLGSAEGTIARFLTGYLDQQRRLLAATIHDHAQALALVDDVGLRDRLHTVYQEALAL